MKVVILSPVFVEGVEYQENILVKYYEKFGHDVDVITSTNRSLFDFIDLRHDTQATSQTYKIGRSTIHRLRYAFNILGRLQRFPDITPMLEKIKPDLIFVRDVMLNLTDCVRYVRRHPECKMILDFHGDYSNSGRNWLSLLVIHRLIRKSILTRARRFLSKIFPVTPGSRRFMQEVYGVPLAEMEILPLGADVDVGGPILAGDARDALRSKYGISRNAKVIVTGGKLLPVRRTELLIEAFKKLARQDAYLIVVGDGPPGDQTYKQMLLRLSEGNDMIRFVGWLSPKDIYRHFAMSDIAAFPASQSILWQQAISMGLPLIIGDQVNGDQDVSYLNLYDNILTADPSRPLADEIYTMVQALVTDDDLRQRMAQGALKTSAEILDWNVLLNRTLVFVDPKTSAAAS